MKAIVILPLLLIGLIPLAFADNLELSDTEFNYGDIIEISGNIENFSDHSVTIQIFYNDDVIDVSQTLLSSNGDFSHTVVADDSLLKYQGDYLVRVHNDGRILETTFELLDGEKSHESTTIQFSNSPTYAELKKMNDDLMVENSLLKKELESEKNDKGLEKQIKVLQNQVTNLTTENSRLKENIDTLQNEINQLNQIIQEQIKIIFDWVINRS